MSSMRRANNKRRHPELSTSHEQGAVAGEKKKARRLPVPWMTGEMASVAAVLPRAMTEYTTEDAARFAEDMARTDKMIDELDARMLSFDPRPMPGPYISPGLRFHEEQKEEEDVVVGDLLVSKADAKMLRSFAASSGYYPVSERFLCDRRLINEAGADICRRTDRFMSKMYAWTQEGAREVVRRYDAARQAQAQAGQSQKQKQGSRFDINPPVSTRRPADADH